jgi:hypothetical protein
MRASQMTVCSVGKKWGMIECAMRPTCPLGAAWVNISEAGCMKSVGSCRKYIKLAEICEWSHMNSKMHSGKILVDSNSNPHTPRSLIH